MQKFKDPPICNCREPNVLADGPCGNTATRLVYGPKPKGLGNRVAYPMCAACTEVAVGKGRQVVMAGEPYQLATVSLASIPRGRTTNVHMVDEAAYYPAQTAKKPTQPIVVAPTTKPAANATKTVKTKRKTTKSPR